MENKKEGKVSILTLIVLIIIVALVSVGGTYMYMNSKKENNNNNGEPNTSQIAEETIKETKKDDEDKEEDSNSSSTDNTVKEEQKEVSENEIKNSLQSYLDLIGVREGAPSEMLKKLNLMKEEPNNDPDNDNYKKTNIKWSDFKAAMENYVTKEWFETNCTKGFKEVNGLVYYFDGGATGLEYKVESITLKGDYSDLIYIAKVNNIAIDGSKEVENVEFAIENINGKCVISYCDI